MNKFKSLLLYGKSVMCIQFGSCVALLFSAQQCFLHCGPKRASSKKQKQKRPTACLLCHCSLNIYDSASQHASKCMIAYYVIVIKV